LVEKEKPETGEGEQGEYTEASSCHFGYESVTVSNDCINSK
jgi:hypothetical protein